MKNKEKTSLLTYVLSGLLVASIVASLCSCSVQSNCCANKSFKVNKAKSAYGNNKFTHKKYHVSALNR